MYRDNTKIIGRSLETVFDNLALLLVPRAGVLGVVDDLDKVKSLSSIEGDTGRADLYLTGDRVIVGD